MPTIKDMCKSVIAQWEEDSTSHQVFASALALLRHCILPALDHQVQQEKNKDVYGPAQRLQEIVGHFWMYTIH